MSAPEQTVTLTDRVTLRSGMTLKNRLVKAAMSEQLGALDGAPTAELERLYGRWACGGLGLSITGNVMIDRRSIGEPRNVVVEDDRDRAGLERWAAAASAEGTTAIVQVNHPGRQTPAGLSTRVVAPSAIGLAYKGAFPKPRALEGEEVHELVARFAETARLVVEAGFSGVQLHGAHGYLISQFLSPRANVREDEWGGDAAGRRRFLLEVARATREAIGPDRILGVKLNSADFQKGGFGEDESLEVIRLLDELGVDLLEVSGGTYESPAMTGTTEQAESTVAREAYFLTFAERAREVAPELPLMVTGGFRSGRAMQAAVTEGATDLIGLARRSRWSPTCRPHCSPTRRGPGPPSSSTASGSGSSTGPPTCGGPSTSSPASGQGRSPTRSTGRAGRCSTLSCATGATRSGDAAAEGPFGFEPAERARSRTPRAPLRLILRAAIEVSRGARGSGPRAG